MSYLKRKQEKSPIIESGTHVGRKEWDLILADLLFSNLKAWLWK